MVIKESVNNKIDNFRKNANPGLNNFINNFFHNKFHQKFFKIFFYKRITVCSKLEPAVNIIDEKMKLLTISKVCLY